MKKYNKTKVKIKKNHNLKINCTNTLFIIEDNY